MSDHQAHTKEPWSYSRENGEILSPLPPHHDGYGGQLIGESITRLNGERIVACVNGCAGINPAGLGNAIHEIEIRAREINEGYDGAEESFNIATARAAAREILAIVAKLRGDAP